MATKHDEFKVYYFSFTDEEIDVIVEILLASGNEELAEEILEESSGVCGDFDCGGEGNIAALKFNIDTSGITEARKEIDDLAEASRGLQEVIEKLQIGNVKFRGEWLSDIVGAIADEAYKEYGIKIEVAR